MLPGLVVLLVLVVRVVAVAASERVKDVRFPPSLALKQFILGCGSGGWGSAGRELP